MMAKTKPILFSTAMVQAIKDGRKTQTRRILKDQPIPATAHDGFEFWHVPKLGALDGFIVDKAPYQPGDILYVRETWFNDADAGESPIIIYKVDDPDFPRGSSPWKPSLFMKKEYARIFLKVTAVKAERLQDISEADAINEGVFIHKVYPSPRMEFFKLWETINGKESYFANPWVWAYTFERTENPNQSTNHQI